MKIQLLYGTETGNAEMLCEDIETHLADDHEVALANLNDIDPADLDADTFHLVVCSTYGDGDLPASAQPFADTLETAGTDLSAIRFAIFGLGDSSYETYNQGSEKLAALLVKHGAKQVGDRAIHDAMGSDMAEDLALPWADDRIAQAADLFAET
ncbi:nitric oxide synthase [Pseudooceanicola sediminis]|uniref:Nitric oxide synthase n=1 Tax=Pseudooceanicola sediminis TaxID=2211117 RepID=A0A399J3F1_9RHOB|nr:flavodoxin domain-containing protein [Pseudooceanicola sediminis]KAA2314290.1 nitric oxide synthase [Puniceibacterium sp. HSS470]RII39855.1 nitric oxide synthase [Pseudooceanicola sediminis]|tara:strand:+ start:38666 stop:39127 length:462 start_codon:yes stop_codon:yes gene_type:complete